MKGNQRLKKEYNSEPTHHELHEMQTPPPLCPPSSPMPHGLTSLSLIHKGLCNALEFFCFLIIIIIINSKELLVELEGWGKGKDGHAGI